MDETTDLDTAIDYLSATTHAGSYRYLDNTSGKYWLSSAEDMELLGEQLKDYRRADEAGEIDEEQGLSDYHVYSHWCGDTDCLPA